MGRTNKKNKNKDKDKAKKQGQPASCHTCQKKKEGGVYMNGSSSVPGSGSSSVVETRQGQGQGAKE
jgi:hypothetical protein